MATKRINDLPYRQDTGSLDGSENIAIDSATMERTTLQDVVDELAVTPADIGTSVQAYSADLDAIAGLGSSANKLPYYTGSETAALADFSSFGRSLVDDASASAARTTLGLAIGSDVQAYAANLDSWSLVDPDDYYSSADVDAALTDYTTTALLASTSNGEGASLIGIEDAGSVYTSTDVEGALAEVRGVADGIAADYLDSSDIGSTVQAYNAQLADIAGLTPAQGNILYYDGSNWVVLAPGTDGQLLKTSGVGANPEWISASGTGDMIAANNLSDVASAATSFDNIKQAATDSATGVVEKATAAEIAAATADKYPDASGVLSAMAFATITPGASPSVNHAAGVNQKITHSANATMGAPSSSKVGWPLNIWIVPGAYTTAWNAVYKFGSDGAPTIDAEGIACFVCLDSSNYVFLGFREKA